MPCKTCDGTGNILYDDDPSGGLRCGLSAGTMQFGEACPDCLGQDKCPHCGEAECLVGTDDAFECSVCGWVYDDTKGRSVIDGN